MSRNRDRSTCVQSTDGSDSDDDRERAATPALPIGAGRAGGRAATITIEPPGAAAHHRARAPCSHPVKVCMTICGTDDPDHSRARDRRLHFIVVPPQPGSPFPDFAPSLPSRRVLRSRSRVRHPRGHDPPLDGSCLRVTSPVPTSTSSEPPHPRVESCAFPEQLAIVPPSLAPESWKPGRRPS